jgi:hypothetical protein
LRSLLGDPSGTFKESNTIGAGYKGLLNAGLSAQF